MRLLLIRHAQSANNLLFSQTGASVGRQPDPAITETGHRQAAALARHLAAEIEAGRFPRITHLYTSMMQRTIQTAAPLADALDLPLVARLDTFEHPGPYDGALADRLAHRGSPRSALAALSARAQLPDEATEEGWFLGELEDDATTFARAQQLIAVLREAHGEDDVVAVVSHGWFGSVLVRAAVGAGEDAWFEHENTAHTLLAWEFWPGDGENPGREQVVVGWQNRHDHLDPADVTR